MEKLIRKEIHYSDELGYALDNGIVSPILSALKNLPPDARVDLHDFDYGYYYTFVEETDEDFQARVSETLRKQKIAREQDGDIIQLIRERMRELELQMEDNAQAKVEYNQHREHLMNRYGLEG